jgi:presenilin-like A22 family membrane protease
MVFPCCFLYNGNQTIAAILALVLALIKIYKPTTILQNLTEIFIYGGLAAIFVPVMNIFAVFALLILISIYDIIAVRHTKHMIKLAKFQTKSKIFAGLLIPYGKGKITKKDKGVIQKKGVGKIAVLGGGDIGLPLIFAGVIMKDLMLNNPELIGFLKTLIIPVFVSLALLYLLVKSEKNKFYPAMPYLTVGCVVGYFVVLLFF